MIIRTVKFKVFNRYVVALQFAIDSECWYFPTKNHGKLTQLIALSISSDEELKALQLFLFGLLLTVGWG